MNNQEETTIQCPHNCGRTIYQSELCVCQQDKTYTPIQANPLSRWCTECNGAGYTTTNNVNQICLNPIHNQ